jgi:hypothetical protein
MEQCERALNKTYTITSLFRGQAQDVLNLFFFKNY